MSVPTSPHQTRVERIEAALRRHPNRTMWIGVLLELLGVATVALIVWHEVRREATLLDEATKYAWRLGWHDTLHDRRFLPLVVLAVCVYLAGAVLIAMRWVHSRVGLFVGVPVAALVSAAVLGALVLIIALLIATDGSIADGIDLDWGSARRRDRAATRQPVEDAVATPVGNDGAG